MTRGFDVFAPHFDAWRGPPGEEEIDGLARLLAGSRRVLDVGGGTGRYAAPLAEQGHALTLLDPSRGMLREARRKGLPGLVAGTATRMPFPDGSFDALLFVEMLHLMARWVDVVHEMGRVARGPVVAVIKERIPDPRRVFLDVRSEVLGGRPGVLEEGVRAFRQMLPPVDVLRVRTRTRRVDLAEVVAGLEKQAALVAPIEARPPAEDLAAMEEVARRTLERIRERYGSTEVDQVEHVDLARWSSEAFRRFAPPG